MAKAAEQEKKDVKVSKVVNKEDSEEKLVIDADYVPIDFDSYSVSHCGLSSDKKIDPEEKLWRISSLTASVDDDTKILLLPLPESRRTVKIADTKYQLNTYASLAKFIAENEDKLETEK